MNISTMVPPRSTKPFPKCAEGCSMVELLGVCECESVCPHKFDKDGNPLLDILPELL